MAEKVLMELKGITKSYQNGDQELQVLKGIDLTVHEGEFLAIMGPSGSGKSTLMNIIGLLDKPTSGEYTLAGQAVERLTSKEQARVRNEELGFVFQQFFLLSKLNAQDNVELPLIYAGVGGSQRHKLAQQYLEKVELSDRSKHLPSELSGGQKQRVAIARALVNNPSIILADEPTGALDTKTSNQILELLTQLNEEGKTITVGQVAAFKKVIQEGLNNLLPLQDFLLANQGPINPGPQEPHPHGCLS
ncbi:ABC transporter ATP-binding protein [Streptococcus sobrinus]|uniref:ABC transporter ATP-binding protein n=3 Tax=Bacteria TaxID=2 RepID=UPI0034C621DF